LTELLFLSRGEVMESVTMAEAVDSCEEAYKALSAGRAVAPVRVPVEVKKHNGVTLFMPCHLPGVDSTGVKVVSVYPGNVKRGLPTIAGLMVMVDATTGTPVAVMEAGYLTALRTGAASGAASRQLSRPDARVAAILGAGAQGRTQLEATAAVRPIEEARIYDVFEESARAFAAEMAPRLGIDISVTQDPGECVDGADIVCCATTSRTPVFPGDRLKPGVHVNGIGSFTPQMQEVGEDTLLRCSLVVVDSMEAAMEEAGDLLIPIGRGSFRKEDIHGEIGQIMLGKKHGRQGPEEITFFKAVGVSVLDVAVGHLIYQKAIDRGLGTPVRLQ
jgi:alanine dehydrogenase